MTLPKEWFMQSKEREAQRNENGVKLEHAIEDLRMIKSPVAPYAWEMAEWIYRNWTLEQFLQLPEPEREIVMQYVDNNVSYPGVKAARQKRRLERKASEQAEKEARKNKLPFAEESDENEDSDDTTSESQGLNECAPSKPAAPFAPPHSTMPKPKARHYGRTYSDADKTDL